MIETLRIADLAIVESAELEFGPGLNVLTGETGAGKSIVLGALALLAGARGGARALRDGVEQAVVEALFRTEGSASLEAELESRGWETDDHELVVRRAITRTGRSRAWVAGQLVPIAALGELFSGRLEISSQHDSQALLRTELHGELLDRWGGLEREAAAVSEEVARLRALARELETLRDATRDRVQRQDFLAFQLNEIDEAKLGPGEQETLLANRSRLAHADRLRREGGDALARLAGDPSDPNSRGAGDLLAGAARALRELGELDAELVPLAERLDAALAEVREAAGDLERHLDRIEADPNRLAEVEDRLHRIEQLERKYGETIDAVLAHRDSVAQELDEVQGADARESELERELDAGKTRLEAAGRTLSAGRAKAATRLGRAVGKVLRDLAMPDARFAVELPAAPPPSGLPCGAGGFETPEFALSANRGEAPRPLRQVASGGELSRAFLALKQALREQSSGMVLVFDEVDAGIGGEAADRVGQRLAELALRHQVLCITHLPSIAAYADTHFRVSKQATGKRTAVRIQQVEGTERIDEIARMAGGDQAGEAAHDYARELLATRGDR